MAQIKIRKYNPGGVLTTETGDTFTLEEIEQLVRENPTNENLKDIANELRAGKNVQHSISDNWSSVTDDDFNAGQKRRIAKNPNSFGRRLAATFNTQVHQYGEDVNDTTALLSAARKNASTNASTNAGRDITNAVSVPIDEYTLISSGGGSRFVYDDNGAYVNGDFTNAKLMSLLRDLNNYFADDNGGASYKFKGISADVRKTLKEMYDVNPNLFNDLMNKIQSGQIIEGSPEASLLLSIGIGSNMTKDQVEQAAKDKALKDYFAGKGFTGDQYKEFLPFVELDGQGLRLKDGIEGGPFVAGQNYYFNDDYNGPFKDLVKGQILFNNRFYDAEQLTGSGMISDWVKALREHRFTDADAMIKWDWKGVGNNYDYQLFDNKKFYNTFLDGKRYLDVTGQYEKTYDDDGNLYQIMGYYDPNDQNNYTALGFVDPSKIKYARFDSMGNLIDENYNTAFLRRAANPWSHESSFQGRRDDGQVEIPTITTRNGRGILGMDVTFNPDKGTVQFHGASVQDVLGADNGDAIELDGEIAQILSPKFFENLNGINKFDLKKFKDTILSLVGTSMGNTWVRNQLSKREWKKLLEPTYGADADKYANILFDYFKSYIGSTSRAAKRFKVLALPGYGAFSTRPGRETRLHEFTPKHQQGGLFTGSAVAASSAPRVVQSDKYTPATTEEAAVFDVNNWTDADYWELGGLAADLSSVVTGVTGFTPASVVTGLAGTGSTFMADIKRDGFQMKDLGNLGLGLLFDAASIVPGLGVAASAGQVMRTLKKGLPVLMKLAGMAGVGSSLSLAVSKIQSGEEITMRDLRILMNGVLGAYTLSKQGIDITNSKAKDGVNVDANVQKLHMDKIDSSNLSEGQKAAMKHFFDIDPGKPSNKYRDTITDPEQQKLFDQFIRDGADEYALKMIIGENNPTFENLRSQLEILRKAQDALTTGRPLTKEENAEYSRLLNELEVRKHMTKEEYDALRDMTQSNEELAGALRTLVSNPGDAAAKAIVAEKYNIPEYKAIIDKYNAIPREHRLTLLEKELASTPNEYSTSMFSLRNKYYKGMGVKKATEVKNADFEADLALKEHSDADAAYNKAKSRVIDSNEYKNAANDLQKEAILIKATDAETQRLQFAKDKLAELEARGIVKLNSDAKYVKTEEHIERVNDVMANFNVSERTRSAIKRELDAEPKLSDASRKAAAKLNHEESVNKLIDDEIVKVQRNVDDPTLWNSEFRNLTPEERIEVSKILNKEWGDLDSKDIDLLNYYTAKSHGIVDTDIKAAVSASKKAAGNEEAFKNFELKPEYGLEKVSILLRRKNIPSKIGLTEVEWAKVKAADDQVGTFKSILKKKKINDNVIDEVVEEVFTEVKAPTKSNKSWFKRKKSESSDTPTNADDISPDFKINKHKFKSRDKDDNTIIGKILGRSTKQKAYAKDLYRIDNKRNIWSQDRTTQKSANRYYQPMVHGLHYNLMRDPVHHTPWYEPKEITIQLENEEE